MFTGIIEELGRIKRIDSGGVVVSAGVVLSDVKLGDSIAVNGVCLTVSAYDEDSFFASVMEETFKKTNLGDLSVGSAVNLERALKLGERLGGHLVSGHIDGRGLVCGLEGLSNSTLMTIRPERELLPFIASKGSITIDGVSLTVVDVTGEFTVSLVEHTLSNTSLGACQIGGSVNLETDILAKYIQRLIAVNKDWPEATSINKLFKEGFIL